MTKAKNNIVDQHESINENRSNVESTCSRRIRSSWLIQIRKLLREEVDVNVYFPSICLLYHYNGARIIRTEIEEHFVQIK